MGERTLTTMDAVRGERDTNMLVDTSNALASAGVDSLRARVTGNYERKGHRFVELDALAIANGRTALARIAHTAIYRPRQVEAAA